MPARLEHANLTVQDIDATLAFLQTAFPEFVIRFDGHDANGARWVHFGDDHSYLALTKASRRSSEPWLPYEGCAGVNHLAFEVDDVESLRRRLSEAGYRDSTVANAHPHRKRVYFYDPDGNDWEFIEYLSDSAAERNDYGINDKPSRSQ